MLYLPLSTFGILHGLGLFLTIEAVGSFLLSVLFSISHNLDDAKDAHDDDGNDWGIMQTCHSANYGGIIGSILSGGLNLQIEHHLFPQMPWVKYVEIVPIVKDECRKRKVKYNQYSTAFPMIWDFLKFLRNVGNAP